jgi:psiF repeat
MKNLVRLMIVGAFVFSFAQSGYAQTSPPAAPAAPAAPTDAMAKKAKAKDCSAQAKAQGLHGKARKEFRAKCMES